MKIRHRRDQRVEIVPVNRRFQIIAVRMKIRAVPQARDVNRLIKQADTQSSLRRVEHNGQLPLFAGGVFVKLLCIQFRLQRREIVFQRVFVHADTVLAARVVPRVDAADRHGA